MKKVLIFLLLVGAIFVYANRDTYSPIVNEQIDVYIPEPVQEGFAFLFQLIGKGYAVTTSGIDAARIAIKDFSIRESNLIVSSVTDTPQAYSVSPIISNTSSVFRGDISLVTKGYAVLLVLLTLLFWSKGITLLWVFILLYLLLKRIFGSFRDRRKKTFFDKIGEKVPRDRDDY